MNASVPDKTQVIAECEVFTKLRQLELEVHSLLKGQRCVIPETPGRDVQIWAIRDLPPKKGLSSIEGQARLLHDLASIELQAMELAIRTLAEFPEAPQEFREQLAMVCLDEGRHLRLCLQALDDLGFPWGSFPTHIGLWQSVSADDSLLDRIVIVHRYLEGSGLDASETLLKRLDGVKNARSVAEVVRVIRAEEEGHVRFGSRWYVEIAKRQGLDPEEDFAPRLKRLFYRIPRRLEPVRRELRLAAGFTPKEIHTLEELRSLWLTATQRIHRH